MKIAWSVGHGLCMIKSHYDINGKYEVVRYVRMLTPRCKNLLYIWMHKMLAGVKRMNLIVLYFPPIYLFMTKRSSFQSRGYKFLSARNCIYVEAVLVFITDDIKLYIYSHLSLPPLYF